MDPKIVISGVLGFTNNVPGFSGVIVSTGLEAVSGGANTVQNMAQNRIFCPQLSSPAITRRHARSSTFTTRQVAFPMPGGSVGTPQAPVPRVGAR